MTVPSSVLACWVKTHFGWLCSQVHRSGWVCSDLVAASWGYLMQAGAEEAQHPCLAADTDIFKSQRALPTTSNTLWRGSELSFRGMPDEAQGIFKISRHVRATVLCLVLTIKKALYHTHAYVGHMTNYQLSVQI